MIHNLLPVVGGELNEYLKSRFDISEDRLILSNLINQDGTVAVEESNKVVCSLLRVQEETTLKSTAGTSSMGGSFVSSGADINVNLTVMFSSFFSGKNYVEALKFLSGVIYFFQSKPTQIMLIWGAKFIDQLRRDRIVQKTNQNQNDRETNPHTPLPKIAGD